MKILTSEQVFKGHPDKICDQISDAILDECLSGDKTSRVAVECLLKDNTLVIAGEVTTKSKIDYKEVALQTLNEISIKDDIDVILKISEQSEDIALGVDKEGAGDQGIMYGYACDETGERIPLPIALANKIAKRMDELSRQYYDYFGIDGKCQVSVEYDDKDNPIRVSTIVISQQTLPHASRDFYFGFIVDECIKKVIPEELLIDTQILINPTGEFVKGGSYADCGLTGRKIICDTYGGIGRHGGGAFSGKDVTKVDRIGAYYARWVAKNIVDSGIAKKCEVQVAYAIGIDKEIAVNVDTFGTSNYSNEQIKDMVSELFSFKVSIIKRLMRSDTLKYQDLASYGHVGRTDLDLPWEQSVLVELIQNYLKRKYE